MNKTKHSPGPWKADIGVTYVAVHDANLGTIYSNLSPELPRRGGRETVEANARLMATAPEGYDLARNVIDWIEQMRSVGRYLPGFASLDNAARKVVSKVEGDTP